MTSSLPLRGRTILVVEDEQLVAMLIEDALHDAGATVLGPAATVAEALDLLGGTLPDGAVMDMNLCGHSGAPVADRLAALGVPFLIATGYGAAGLPPGHEAVPVLAKPFDPNDLIRQLARMATARDAPAGNAAPA